MADVAGLLATLHPMREPPPPATVAPFLVSFVVGVVTAVVAVVVATRARRGWARVRRSAEAALAASRRLAPGDRLAHQAQILRRLVHALQGEAAARTTGQDWLGVLDRTFKTQWFSADRGRIFADGLYRRDHDVDVEGLDRSLQILIAGLRA